ncbi:MAG: type II secretion system minor pseudopilin GspI [Pseudomonadota bacterium]
MRASRQRGFTLLEVLVALVVVSVGLAAISRLGVQHAQSAMALDELTLAGWVASNTIELARLEPSGLNVGRRQGQTTMGRQRWYWEMNVAQTEVDSILRLDVAVFADSRRQQQVVSLSGFMPQAVAGPAPSAAGAGP